MIYHNKKYNLSWILRFYFFEIQKYFLEFYYKKNLNLFKLFFLYKLKFFKNIINEENYIFDMYFGSKLMLRVKVYLIKRDFHW